MSFLLSELFQQNGWASLDFECKLVHDQVARDEAAHLEAPPTTAPVEVNQVESPCQLNLEGPPPKRKYTREESLSCPEI